MNNEKQMDKKCDQPGGTCCQELAWEAIDSKSEEGNQSLREENRSEATPGTCGGACACGDV